MQFDLATLKALGGDTFVSPMAFIRRPHLVSLGEHTAIDWGVYITTAADIGDFVHIAPYVTVIGGAKALFVAKHFSTIAAGSRIICGSDEHKGAGLVGPTIPEPYKDIIKIAPIVLEKFANVGTNVVIMPGVTLGEGSVVGSCSLVNKDTDPWGIYVGVPAKKVGERPKDTMLAYAEKLGY